MLTINSYIKSITINNVTFEIDGNTLPFIVDQFNEKFTTMNGLANNTRDFEIYVNDYNDGEIITIRKINSNDDNRTIVDINLKVIEDTEKYLNDDTKKYIKKHNLNNNTSYITCTSGDVININEAIDMFFLFEKEDTEIYKDDKIDVYITHEGDDADKSTLSSYMENSIEIISYF